MAFYKEHTITLNNSEKEYKLAIKIQKDEDLLKFILQEKNNSANDNYYLETTLDELKSLNPFFRMFESINKCANSISNIIRDSTPKLLIDKDKANLIINIFVPGSDKIAIKLILEKKVIESNSIINQLLEEVNKLKAKVNDLEILINKKNSTINEIQNNYEQLKRNHELLQQQHKIDFINLRSYIPQQNNNLNPNLNTFEELQKLNDNENSLIINNILELNFLSNKFRLIYPGKNTIYNLLYRKSRDSDKALAFHSKCDKIRGTLIIIKTENGLKFGGYTNESWEGNNVTKVDNTAFIFSLNNNKVYDIKSNVNAIFCSPFYGPYFCGNNNPTLFVNDDSNTRGGICCKAAESNYCGYFDDYEINNGNPNFRINEMEVFKVSIVS